jgi:YD repeat-containing protein
MPTENVTLPNPVITGITPATGPPGATVTVSGAGLGATQGTSTLSFNGATATISSWSDSQIVAFVPDAATTRPVSVTEAGITAQGPTFTVAFSAQLTDSLGNQTSYVSSLVGGQWSYTNAQGSGCSSCTTRGNIVNQYDANGNLLWRTDALGNTTLFRYDSSNNLTTQSVPISATARATSTYTYNSLGEVLTSTDPLGFVTTNAYDSKGNLTSVTTPVPGGGPAASVTQFAYNSLGEMTQITDPLNHVTTLTYTSAGLIVTITDAQSHVTTYGYDSRGNRTSVKRPTTI